MQYINVGTSPNDRTGDKLRQAAIKVNNNFGIVETEFIKREDLGTPGNPPIISSGNTIEAIMSIRSMDQNDPETIFTPESGEIVINTTRGRPSYLCIGDGNTSIPIGLFGFLGSEELFAEGGTDWVDVDSIFKIPSGVYSGLLSANLLFNNLSSDGGELYMNGGICLGMMSIDGSGFTPVTISNEGVANIVPNTTTLFMFNLQSTSLVGPADESPVFRFRKATNVDSGNSISLSSYSVVGQILYNLTQEPE